MPHDRKQQRNNLLQGLSLFSQIGFSMASCVLFGVLAGKFLDTRLGTSPWLLLLFSLVGVAASFKVLFDLVKRM